MFFAESKSDIARFARSDIIFVFSCRKANITEKALAFRKCFFMVDLVGLEPMTSALRTQRSPN